MNWLIAEETHLILQLRVQPGAGRSALAGCYDDGEQVRLKLALKEQPEDGKANKAAIKFLAKKLGLKQADIQLKSGATARNKTFIIHNIDAKTATEKLTHDT